MKAFVKGKVNLTRTHAKKALEQILKKDVQIREVCDFIELNRHFHVSKVETLKKVDILASNNNYYYCYVNRYLKELSKFDSDVFTFQVKDYILYVRVKEVSLDKLAEYLV
jgi:hypothetical protein